MDEQRVCVVLDAEAVRGIRLFVKPSGSPTAKGVIRDKGRPPASALWGTNGFAGWHQTRLPQDNIAFWCGRVL
jgi:hypothetical protein